MASTPTAGGLRFEIVADPSQFNSAVAEADTRWKSATQQMSASSSSWGDDFVRVTDQIGSVIGSVASVMQQAFTGGADGAEKATLASLDKIRASTEGMLDQLGGVVERWGGKLGKRLGDGVGSVLKGVIDPVTDKLTEGLDVVVSSERFSGAVNVTKEWAASLDQATNAAGKLEERLAEATTGFANAIKVARGERLGVDTFNAIVDSLDKQIEKHNRATQILGKTADEVARLRAEWDLLDAGIDPAKMAADQTEKYDAKLAERAAAAAAEEAAKAGVRQAEAYRGITADLQRQIDLGEAKLNQGARSAGQLAEENTLIEAAARMRARGRELTSEELAEVARLAALRGVVADEAARENISRQSALNAQRAVRNWEMEVATLGLAPGAAAEAKAFAADLQRAREANIELTKEMKEGMAANARSIGEVTQATADMRERMQQIRDTGQVVARSLEQAFSSFIEGNKVSWREMVASMIADMAKLTLRQNVLQPLFGGGAGGGGGLIGNAISGLFQARASGGPVSSGLPYVVGEKRPELFVPQSSGQILPQVPAAGTVRNTQLAFNIDARGATPDAVRMLEARIPSMILQHVAEARERGVLA